MNETDPTAGLLAGLTVVEVPNSVAVRYCGRLLAALGARVWQAGPPDDLGVGYGGAGSTAYAAWLDAGKRRAPAGLAQALAQAAGADLVVTGPDAADVAAADAAIAGLGTASAPLRLGLTWFATDGAYRDWAGADALIQALSGNAYATGPTDGDPMLPRGHAPQVVAGTVATIAALGALLGRRRGWTGRHIDVDALSASLCFNESTTCSAVPAGTGVVRRGVNRFTPTYPAGIFRTADGWVGITALIPSQWATLCDMLGLPALGRDPALQVALNRLERADELDALLRPAIARQSSAWWLAEGQARRIPFAPVPSLAELPTLDHWRERGSFGAVPDVAGAVGPTLPFRASEVASVASAAPPQAGAGRAVTPPAPLSGLRVLDLSMGWAGPLAARHLADLGAEVVKVEGCGHMDWWRGFDAFVDADPPPYETRPGFLMVNRHKHGITLDLKTDAGRDLLRQIADHSDVMVENYAPGVLAKLGVGAQAMAQRVPGLVALSMGAFGNRGPWSGFRAYGSTVEQASGLPFVNGEAADPPTMQHVAYGDPVAGLYAAVAALAGLLAREAAGDGHAVSRVFDLGQVECLFQLGADAIVAQSLQPEPLARSGSRHPASLLRMVSRSAAPSTWLAVAVETQHQWNALAGVLARADLVLDTGSALALAQTRSGEMETGVRAWASAQSADTAVAALQAAGVPAAPLRPGSALMDDPQLGRNFCWLARPFIGRHLSTLSPYRFDGSATDPGPPAPTLGQANAAVLQGLLGLDDAALAALAAQGVIGTRAMVSG